MRHILGRKKRILRLDHQSPTVKAHSLSLMGVSEDVSELQDQSFSLGKSLGSQAATEREGLSGARTARIGKVDWIEYLILQQRVVNWSL
jgi:hypothetical protein